MVDTVRLTCTAEGYEANYIDLHSRWTRADTKRLDGIEDEAYIDFLREKLAGVHLEICDVAGKVVETIDSPSELTDDAFDELDEVLIGWLGGALYTFIGNRRTLGNLSARVSSATNGKAEIPALTQAKSQATES